MLHELGPLRHGQAGRHEGDRVLRRLRAPAVVGPAGRDRVRRQGHPRRRVRAHHRVHLHRGGGPRRTSPGPTASSPSTSGSSWPRPARPCTSSSPSCWPLILVLSFGQADEQLHGGLARALARAARRRPRWPGLQAGDTIVSIDGKTFTNPNSMTDVIKALRRQAAHPRGRARRQAHPPDGHARERQGDQGGRPEAGQPRLPRRRDRAPPPRPVGRRWPPRAPRSPPCGRSPTRRSPGIGQTLLAHRAVGSVCHQVTQLQGRPVRGRTTPARRRGPSPSSASPTSARSRSRRAWPRS